MKISRISDVNLPTRGTDRSAGLDFYVPNEFVSTDLLPGESINIASGIMVDVPKGFALIAFNKSGVSLNQRLQVGACVIDEDYQGELSLHVYNTSNSIMTINPGQKIMQFLLIPVIYEPVEEVHVSMLFDKKSERGKGGFGSTGLYDKSEPRDFCKTRTDLPDDYPRYKEVAKAIGSFGANGEKEVAKNIKALSATESGSGQQIEKTFDPQELMRRDIVYFSGNRHAIHTRPQWKAFMEEVPNNKAPWEDDWSDNKPEDNNEEE